MLNLHPENENSPTSCQKLDVVVVETSSQRPESLSGPAHYIFTERVQIIDRGGNEATVSNSDEKKKSVRPTMGVSVASEFARRRGRKATAVPAWMRQRNKAVLALFFSRMAWRREEALPVPAGTVEDEGFAAGVPLAAVEEVAVRSSLTCEVFRFGKKKYDEYREQSRSLEISKLQQAVREQTLLKVTLQATNKKRALRPCGP